MMKKIRSFIKVKHSSSCSEDLELDDRETKSYEATKSCLEYGVDDRQSSVVFAKDLIDRSEKTLNCNPNESLNILLQGRRKMKEYSDGRETESTKAGLSNMTWNSVIQDQFISKKLPEEHPDLTPNTPTEKDKTTNRRSCVEKDPCEDVSLVPEDGCDKNETKQTSSSKCVKSSDSRAIGKNDSGKQTTVSSLNNHRSSCGGNGGDDDENNDDNNSKRNKVQEKNDGDVLISEDAEEQARKLENTEAIIKKTQNTKEVQVAGLTINAETNPVIQHMKGQSDTTEVLEGEQAMEQIIEAHNHTKDMEVVSCQDVIKIVGQGVSGEQQGTSNWEQQEYNKPRVTREDEDTARTQEHETANRQVLTTEQCASDNECDAPAPDTKQDKQHVPKIKQNTIDNGHGSNSEQSLPDKDKCTADNELCAPSKEHLAPANEQSATAKKHCGTAKRNCDVTVVVQGATGGSRDTSVSNSLGVVVSNSKRRCCSSTSPDEVTRNSINLAAAFKCNGEKNGYIDGCKESSCYSSHVLLEHSRSCKFRVLGGCNECTQLRDMYIYHARHCTSVKCNITKCLAIKEHLKMTNGIGPVVWSYNDDNVFFGKRVEDGDSLILLSQYDNQEPISHLEVEELLQSLKTPFNSTQYENMRSLPEISFNKLPVESQHAVCQNAYMYPPERPPDIEGPSLIQVTDSKVPSSAKDEDLMLPTTQLSIVPGLNSRGVSIHFDNSLSYQQGVTAEAEICLSSEQVLNAEKIEPVVPVRRSENVKWLHRSDKNYLNIKDDRYDEGHEWRNVQGNDFLGRGAFGECRLCTDLASNKLFATKKVQKDKFDSSELDIWASVSEQSVRCLVLFGAVCVDDVVIMFMEYMEGGSIENMMCNLVNNKFDEYSALYILREILESLDFLHSRNIIHRDVKGANVLVNDTLTKVKLGDYGAAVKLDRHEHFKQENRPPGTENFMAPEVCRSDEHSFSADIWSSGCVLYQMMMGHPPWLQYGSVIYKVGTTKEPPSFPECHAAATRDLLSQMFAIVPTDRPTAKELLRHCAFEEVNDPPCPEYLNEDNDEDDYDKKDTLSSEDEFYSCEEDSFSSSTKDADAPSFGGVDHQLVYSDQTQPSANIVDAPAVDGPDHQLVYSDQARPSANIVDAPAVDGPDHELVYSDQTQPSANIVDALKFVGLDQANDADSPAFDGLHHELVDPDQTHPPANEVCGRTFGGFDQMFGLMDQTWQTASCYNAKQSLDGEIVSHSATFPVDDELERLQSDLVQKISLDGGDISDLIGMNSSTSYRDDDEEVFDFNSIAEVSEETDAIHPLGCRYTMKDLTKVELYDESKQLLFTVREKSSCTFGCLAENVHRQIKKKNRNLQCFTFHWEDGSVVDAEKELDFVSHKIQVLPANDSDNWTGWRVDAGGIVELKQPKNDA